MEEFVKKLSPHVVDVTAEAYDFNIPMESEEIDSRDVSPQ